MMVMIKPALGHGSAAQEGKSHFGPFLWWEIVIPMVGNGYSYAIGYGGKCWDGWVSLKASLLRAPYGVNKVGAFMLFSP